MNKDLKFIFLRYIFEKFKSDELAIEGGFVLNYKYKLDRRFSGDIDFTCKSKKHLNRFVKYSKEFAKIHNYTFTTISRIKGILTIEIKGYIDELVMDIYIVPPFVCEYDTWNIGEEINVRHHSINDLIAEKFFCNLDPSREGKDFNDLKQLTELPYEHLKVLELIEAKAKLKIKSYSTYK